MKPEAGEQGWRSDGKLFANFVFYLLSAGERVRVINYNQFFLDIFRSFDKL